MPVERAVRARELITLMATCLVEDLRNLGLNAYRSAAFTGNQVRFAEAYCSVPLPEYRTMFEAYRGGA